MVPSPVMLPLRLILSRFFFWTVPVAYDRIAKVHFPALRYSTEVVHLLCLCISFRLVALFASLLLLLLLMSLFLAYVQLFNPHKKEQQKKSSLSLPPPPPLLIVACVLQIYNLSVCLFLSSALRAKHIVVLLFLSLSLYTQRCCPPSPWRTRSCYYYVYPR
jgi:cbb3-type cytochrome oxidase subunit 3